MASGDGGTVLSDAATEDDELGRGTYVRTLTRLVGGAQTPLVIAIYGAWGSGKTSMMLQVRRALDPRHDAPLEGRRDQPDPPVRTVWFEPWMHQFDEAPALGLLHAVVDQLGVAQRPRVRDALAKIAMAFAEDVKVPVVGVRFGKLRDVREELRAREFEQREERTRLRQHFRAALEAAGASGEQRVVVFIDDLDRCRPEQAVRLLESLKLYLDVPGCVYVLGVDREPLEAAVAVSYQELGLRTESYLDKIIQLPFSIPAIDEESMLDFITTRLPVGLDGCQELLAAASADEPRSVKRLTNALLVNHELALESAFLQPYDVRTLAVLVLIQNLAPDLFRQLRLDPALFGAVFLHRDAPPPPVDDPAAEDGDMWRFYIEPRPRLERALRLYAHDPGRDIGPYLTLTRLAVAEPAAPTATAERSAGRLRLVAERYDAAWATRIQEALQGVGWQIDQYGGALGSAYVSGDPAGRPDALVVVFGQDWVRGGPRSNIGADLLEARAADVPIVPVTLDGVDPSDVLTGFGPELQFLADRQFVSVADESFDRDIAALERALQRLRRWSPPSEYS